MIDLFSVISEHISSALTADLILILVAVLGYSSGKWRKFFYTKKEYVINLFIAIAFVTAFLLLPSTNEYVIGKSILAVCATLYCAVKIYGKNHTIFPKNILIKNWNKIDKYKGKFIYKVSYGVLSTFEKIHVDIIEIKGIYENEPYKAYCRLKKIDISIYEECIQQEYYTIYGVVLMGLGAYAEAQTLLENIVEKDKNCLQAVIALSVLYDRTGKIEKSRELAKEAYNQVASNMLRVDYHLKAQVYHNYAAFLEQQHIYNKAIEIAKEAVDIALKQKDLKLVNMTMSSYLKLLLAHNEENQIAEYWEKYKQKVNPKCDTYMPYVNLKLYLMRMGYPMGDAGKYLSCIYNLNKEKQGTEGRCFLCLSCMNNSLGLGVNTNQYLEDMIQLLEYEVELLEPIKRLRVYDGLTFFMEIYEEACTKNRYNKSPHFIELKKKYENYEDRRKEIEIQQMLDETDSIWIAQKTELRFMRIKLERKKQYDFKKIYSEFIQLYKEYELGMDVRAMINIDMDIVKECESYPNWEFIPERATDVRSSQKDILVKHLEDAITLLDGMEYDAVKAEYAIRISRGYVFAGELDKAREHLMFFQKQQIPESYLTDWEREHLKALRRILQLR